MKLYKFLPKIFHDSFFDTGCLKLGTIYNFKDVVDHTVGRADVSEGSHLIEWNSGERRVVTSKNNHEFAPAIIIEDGASVIMTNVTTIDPRYCNDAFIYCTSRVYNEDIFSRWRSSDSATDSCFIINSPDLFFNEISRHIAQSTYFSGGSSIIYIDEPLISGHPLSEIDPAFTKNRNEYQWQKEHRSRWSPKYPLVPLKPWVVHVPEAVKYCSPFSYFNNGEVIKY